MQTPQFPELTAPSTLTSITLTLGTNLATPSVLSLPNCFSFGTSASNQPTITALLPSQGTFAGGTRVTIIGSGFSTSGVQVFFGSTEATVVSTTFSQVVVLSPPGPPGAGGTVSAPVTVKNINSGIVSGAVTFTYGPALKVTAINPIEEPSDGPCTPVTIFGSGFQAPVAVFAGVRPRSVNSVSATEIVCTPTRRRSSRTAMTSSDRSWSPTSTRAIPSVDRTSAISCKTFAPGLSVSSPASGDVFLNPGLTVTLSGQGLSRVTKVTFGSRDGLLHEGERRAAHRHRAGRPPPSPRVSGRNVQRDGDERRDGRHHRDERHGMHRRTLAQAFTYQRQCVAPTPTPGP